MRRRRTFTVALLAIAFAACSSPMGPEAERSVEVRGVRVDPRTSSPVVLLQESDGMHRTLPIWIGVAEARSIQLALERVEPPRPNTHDLIKNMIEGIRVQLERIVITELRDGTYYALIFVEVDGATVSIDSRPSDAIAVALRTGTPVFAREEVLEEGGGEADRSLEIDLRAPDPFEHRSSGRFDEPQLRVH